MVQLFPYIFLGIFTIIGVINVISPETMWKMRRSMYANPDAMKPSQLSFTLQRFVGIIFLIVVAFMAYQLMTQGIT